MSDRTDELREVFMDVTDEPILTETQEDDHSRAPIDRTDAEMERTVSGYARVDGLDDAVDDDFSDGVSASA